MTKHYQFFKTDKHGICATRHGRVCRHVKLIPVQISHGSLLHPAKTYSLQEVTPHKGDAVGLCMIC